MKTKKPQVKRIPYLDYMSRINERVQWGNMRGEKFEGVVKEWDNNTAIVMMDDGTEKAVAC